MAMDGSLPIGAPELIESFPERGAMLATISNTIVGLYKTFYGKGPTKARSYYLDDMVVCVLRGGLTRAELTLAQSGRSEAVTRQRQEFQAAVRDEFVVWPFRVGGLSPKLTFVLTPDQLQLAPPDGSANPLRPKKSGCSSRPSIF